MLYFEQDIAPIYLKNHSGNGCQVYLQHLALCRHAWIESVNNEILHDDIILKTNYENLGKNS